MEKKKKQYEPTSSKEVDERKPPVEKKATQTHQPLKPSIPEQTVSAFKEK